MADKPTQPDKPRRKRMHEDVPTWVDTCCCEPEPRWQAVDEAWRERNGKQRDGNDAPSD